MSIPILILVICYAIAAAGLALLDANGGARSLILAAMWPLIAVAILMMLVGVGLLSLATMGGPNTDKETTK